MNRAGLNRRRSNMAKGQRPTSRRQAAGGALDLDEALVALFIGAMAANDHVAPDEAARAHHLIWSTRRFRRKSGDTVGKLIEDMRALVEERGSDPVMEAAAAAIPASVRPSAFAVLADLLFADGKMDARERTFLQRMGARLEIDPGTMRQVLDVALLKSQL
jgi:tellurite resistance protein